MLAEHIRFIYLSRNLEWKLCKEQEAEAEEHAPGPGDDEGPGDDGDHGLVTGLATDHTDLLLDSLCEVSRALPATNLLCDNLM